MQKRKEPLSKPLLVVVTPDECGCLNNRQFDKYTRHLPVLMTNPATCSHGYPQKMGKESGAHVISLTRDCSRGSCTSTVQLQHTIFSGNLVSGERSGKMAPGVPPSMLDRARRMLPQQRTPRACQQEHLLVGSAFGPNQPVRPCGRIDAPAPGRY